jgi:hypothetical protein
MAGRRLVTSSPSPRATLRPLKQPRYDTENIPSAGGVATFNFFQRPIGQAFANAPVGAGKTLADTNMQQAAQLGTPTEFDVWGFNCRLNVETTQADHQVALSEAVFTFNFGQGRPWLQTQLRDIPAGVDSTGSMAVDGAAALDVRTIISNGVPSIKELYSFAVGRKPVRIRSNETFGVTVNYPNANPDPAVHVRMTIFLRGIEYAAL